MQKQKLKAAKRGEDSAGGPGILDTTADDARMLRGKPAIVAMIIFGAVLWLALPPGPSGDHARLASWRWAAIFIAALIGGLPGVRRIRLLSPERRAMTAVAIAAAAAIYFVLTATNQDRDFFPKTHDECSYVIQMRMLAHGRLWMPQHELADFFDSFYLLTRPVYVSIYFPGAAMMFVPAIWLGLPVWVIPVIVAGAIVGLVYRIFSELVDGASGALAALLVVSLSWFRMLSIMAMSQLSVLLLGLVMVWAWLRWRQSRHWRWLFLLGACAGWAGIIRPVDGLCFAVAVGLGILFDVYAPKQRRGQPGTWSNASRSLALIVVGALPFLGIQAALNKGVTGSWLRTPFSEYADRDLPGTSYGFHKVDPNARAQSVVRQKQLEYERWAKPLFVAAHAPANLAADWWNRRLPLMADVTLPGRVLLTFLPVGLLALRDRRRWVMATVLGLFVIGYAGYAFFLEHYAVVVVPAVALLIVLGIRKTGEVLPFVLPSIVCGVIALAMTNLWELNHAVSDEALHSTLLRDLHQFNEKNAIILFTFDLDELDPDLVAKIAQEPVYNTDVAWPDDAPVIRAHDLGERNKELFAYYAIHGPDRTVYRFSRRTGAVETLGKVRDLAGK